MFSQNVVDTEEPEDHSYDYDLIVIGGGSGGIACAKEAALLGKRVACFDYVKPSVQGTNWGLGGTCVNVGCIPKKLMHHSSLIGEHLIDAPHFGWKIEEKNTHDWEVLVNNIQGHISSLNWGYRVELREKQVTYHNALAKFVDAHTVEGKFRNQVKKFTARRIVIATGGRPTYPDIPGANLAISSDDIFSYPTPPGKTLVIGASYIALECAGFLTGLGYDVTVLVRSIFLRGFDQEIAEMIGKYMGDHNTKFIRPSVPISIEKLESEKLKVTYAILNEDGSQQSVHEDEFDTVLFAIGRYADTKGLDVDRAGIKSDRYGKIPVDKYERTNIPHIYAIGDIVPGRLELTPTAIKSGRLLSRRLYNNSKLVVDYQCIPTTVFTPLEYGCCGLAEEDAIKEFGEENVETYMTFYKPTSWNVSHRADNVCYVKLVCHKNSQPLPMRVVGFHVLGEEAGEITQGVAVAMKAGATKDHFDETIGIHPTSAESMTLLEVTRSSGESANQKGC